MHAIALSAPTGPVLPVQATTAFDGTWSGTGTPTQRRGRGNSCGPDTTDRRFTIEGGQFTWAYDNRYGVRFSGPIQPNGSFDLTGGSHRLQGQATGSGLTATYTSAECVRSFQMRRRRD
jgi:hypothetical protein